MLTQAEQFAHRFSNDGTNWIDDKGYGFDEVLYDMGVSIEYGKTMFDEDSQEIIYFTVDRSDHITGDPVRAEFSDKSAIVVAGGAWNIEGDRPFSWRDA